MLCIWITSDDLQKLRSLVLDKEFYKINLASGICVSSAGLHKPSQKQEIGQSAALISGGENVLNIAYYGSQKLHNTSVG